MAPSGSNKRTATGVGLATSVLLSPHTPNHTTVMGFGKFFTLPSSSSSSNSSSRPQGSYRPPSSPGSSKVDYASGLGSSNASVPNWSTQSYDPCDGDAPPAYSPKKSDFDGWVADLKIPEPHELRADTFYNPADYGGEDPLLPLKYYDIVIILDDSHSMTARDNPQGISRWDQVSNGSVHTTHTLPSLSEETNTLA